MRLDRKQNAEIAGFSMNQVFAKQKGKFVFDANVQGTLENFVGPLEGEIAETTEVQMLEDTRIRVGLVAVHPIFGEEEVEEVEEDEDEISIGVTVDHSIKTIFGNITIKINNKIIFQINEM